MNRVTEAEMARIRADAEDLLPDIGRIHAFSDEGDGAGGQSETYTPGGDLPASIAPIGRSGSGGNAGDRINEATTHVATFPAGTEIDERDRVEVAGAIYEVTGLREFGEMSATKRVEVKGLGEGA